MKLKNVKVGQRVKVKKRVGYDNQKSFTLDKSESFFGTVTSVVRLAPWEVEFTSDDGGSTYGYAKDLKLIKDTE